MKFSYNWLKELGNFNTTPIELANLINLHITEVETIGQQAANYKGVIVAEILEIEAHPNADKLRLVTLDLGRGKKEKVVCGAPNIEIGQKIPLALVGAELPGGILKPAIIRGVESRGMACSAAELGMEEKSEGILVLPKSASLGKPVNEVLELNDDSILDLKILSNRSDYLSYLGIAREIAAVLEKKWEMPLDFKFKEDLKLQTSKQIQVKVENEKDCPIYYARWVGNVEVRESPDWIKQKLTSAGIRPINNLVDISNLVMLEVGQPIHIFDAGKVKDKKIFVRRAKGAEKIITLDDQERELNPNILIIADQEKPIALAGIMGGASSAVSDLTKEIIIEVASFDPVLIRKGSKNIGLSTDASLRFERGLTSYSVKLAMSRTLSLIQSLLPAAVISQENMIVGEDSTTEVVIQIGIEDINNSIGAELNTKYVTDILERLEFSVKQSGTQLKIVPPPFRLDVKSKADIVEEVVRIWGIDKVEPKMPNVLMNPPITNPMFDKINELKNYLTKVGFSEMPSHCFIGNEWANKLGLKLNSELKLVNPLNSNWTHLSSNLWPNLLQFLTRHNRDKLNVFEINTIFSPPEDKEVLPKEHKVLSIVSYGKTDVYRKVKGILEDVMNNFKDIKFVSVPGSTEDKYINILRIMMGSQVIGSLEEIGSQLMQQLGLKNITVWAELNLSLLLDKGISKEMKFKQFSHYPASSFDLSIKLPNSVSVGNLIGDMECSSSLIKKVDVFDVYQLGNGERSVGIKIVLQSDERTLNDSEIRTTESKLINLVKTKYRGEIRGSEKV